MKTSSIPVWRALGYRLLVLLAIYVLMLFRTGYEFGRNDQMQTLSYTKMLADPDLYPSDFYLRGINAHVPNERFVFAWLMKPLANVLPQASFFLHMAFALLLVYLLHLISKRYIKSEVLRWGVPLLLFLPLYGINLGGNELYYNSFFVSNVVKTIGLAGIYWLLSNRLVAAFTAFAIAAFLQPVVGIQLFLTSSGVLFLENLFRPGSVSAPAPGWKRWFGSISFGQQPQASGSSCYSKTSAMPTCPMR